MAANSLLFRVCYLGNLKLFEALACYDHQWWRGTWDIMGSYGWPVRILRGSNLTCALLRLLLRGWLLAGLRVLLVRRYGCHGYRLTLCQSVTSNPLARRLCRVMILPQWPNSLKGCLVQMTQLVAFVSISWDSSHTAGAKYLPVLATVSFNTSRVDSQWLDCRLPALQCLSKSLTRYNAFVRRWTKK